MYERGIKYGKSNGEYLVSTNDCKIGEKLKLDRVDKYAYEGWLLLSQLPDCFSLSTSFST